VPCSTTVTDFPAPVVAEVLRTDGGVVVGVAHVALVIVLVSRVTAPLRASARPFSVAPVVIEIGVRARMFPTNALLVPIVAELPTCQNTLQGCAPPISRTRLPEPEVSVDPA